MAFLIARRRTESEKVRKDIRVLAELTQVYCRAKHRERQRSAPAPRGELTAHAAALDVQLCSECTKLVLHGSVKRMRCPMDPKPECKHCPEHCYNPRYRQQVRDVMRFAWRHMLKRGRFDLVIKHL